MGVKETELHYMPLKVEYEEKFYAAGKIIGSRYIRREDGPQKRRFSRTLVDAHSPLFDTRIRREIQIVVTVLQIDEQNDPEFVASSEPRSRSSFPTSRGRVRSPAFASFREKAALSSTPTTH